jgi:menaquinone-specific isochorismate synthase
MPRALQSISADTVQKVVVTRQVDVEFDTKVALGAVIDRLARNESNSFTFLVEGLVGASPELLVSLVGGQISSLALAGTALDAESLNSDKMDREHTLSLSSVEDGISPHTTTLDVEERQVLEFGDLNHLATKVGGPAVAGTTVLDVLGSLHPTAAVAGRPSDTALEVIKELEGRSRGRYAGPVGWFNVDGEGEFAIALRCGLINGDKATLYAGGGIVRGSDVDSEFAETELKLRPMLQALGLP